MILLKDEELARKLTYYEHKPFLLLLYVTTCFLTRVNNYQTNKYFRQLFEWLSLTPQFATLSH